jgi:hypothetical protein
VPDVQRYSIHPACAKWPRPSAAEFDALVVDIRAKGLINPIWLMPEGEILEGKIRYEACMLAGVEPRFQTYTGDDPIGFTISQNKLRRHMTKAELAFIGDELAQLQHGTNQHRKKVDAFAKASTSIEQSQDKVGKQLGISRATIQAARSLKERGEPNVIELARAGKIGIQSAAMFARHTSRDKQRAADNETIKKQGSTLRDPKKRPRAKRKTKVIEFSSEQMRELNEQLRPLIKRLREQSRRPIVAFNPIELGMIASGLERCLARWANDGSEVVGPMLRPAVNNKRSGK